MFVEEFKRRPGTIWIMKPAGRAQGKGIFLFTDLKDITEWKKVVNGSKSMFKRLYFFLITINRESLIQVARAMMRIKNR